MNILYSILAGIGFGIAMFMRKLSVQHIGMTGFILEAVVEAILAIILVSILFPINLEKYPLKNYGLIYGVTGGVAIGLGVIFFFLAMKHGPALTPQIIGPVLSAITGSILAVIVLQETLSPIKLIGALIALSGLFIFIKG